MYTILPILLKAHVLYTVSMYAMPAYAGSTIRAYSPNCLIDTWKLQTNSVIWKFHDIWNHMIFRSQRCHVTGFEIWNLQMSHTSNKLSGNSSQYELSLLRMNILLVNFIKSSSWFLDGGCANRHIFVLNVHWLTGL